MKSRHFKWNSQHLFLHRCCHLRAMGQPFPTARSSTGQKSWQGCLSQQWMVLTSIWEMEHKICSRCRPRQCFSFCIPEIFVPPLSGSTHHREGHFSRLWYFNCPGSVDFPCTLCREIAWKKWKRPHKGISLERTLTCHRSLENRNTHLC